jgi:ribonuclease H2 subunit A
MRLVRRRLWVSVYTTFHDERTRRDTFHSEESPDIFLLSFSVSSLPPVAKVMRDRLLEQWKFSEPFGRKSEDAKYDKELRDFGSGYPSDPKCKEWMEKNPACDKVFGYPDLLRFSWAPSKQRLEDTAVSVVFRADLDEEDEELLQQQQGMASFLKMGTTKKRKRFGYFEDRKMRVSKSLIT